MALKSVPCGKCLFSTPKQKITRTSYSFVGTAVIGTVASVLTATATPEPGHRASNSPMTSTEPFIHPMRVDCPRTK